MIAALALSVCGFTYTPPMIWDQLPLPADTQVIEVPMKDIRTLCTKPHSGQVWGCNVGRVVFIPTYKTWPGTRECWLENKRHEESHLKGYTHP